jgi:hypothetical protein
MQREYKSRRADVGLTPRRSQDEGGAKAYEPNTIGTVDTEMAYIETINTS